MRCALGLAETSFNAGRTDRRASLRSLPRSDSSLERRLAEMGAKSPIGKKTKKEEAALAKEAAQQAAVAKETEGLAASAAALGQELRDQEDVVIQGILKQYEKEEGLTFASAEERTKKEEELRAEYRRFVALKSKAKQDDLEYVNSDVTVRDVLTSPITQSALAVGLAALGYLALWYFFRKGIDEE